MDSGNESVGGITIFPSNDSGALYRLRFLKSSRRLAEVDEGLSVIAIKLDALLMLDFYTFYMCMQSWGRSRFDGIMIELRADVELKDVIMVAMPKLVGEGFYICTIRVEYEWKPPSCLSCKVLGHVLDECPKNIISDVEKKLKNPRQAARGVRVVSTVNVDSDSEVEDVVDDHEVFMKLTGLKRGADSGYVHVISNFIPRCNSMHQIKGSSKALFDHHVYKRERFESQEQWYDGESTSVRAVVDFISGRSKSDLELLISYLQGVKLRVGGEDRLLYGLYGDGGIRFGMPLMRIRPWS
ncbi:50S ribosomal protein L10, chloroplastic [Tanacetum coccineum]|uniref:50S ribosomal protein L10, chloroplastic n=1 Tax=Tanacetum coccineum TaxID=301880 RepID=A0ABQ5FX49_9ASTR